MVRTTYYTATTLDGFIADERDSLDWLLVQDNDESGPLNYQDFIADIGAIAMGATTYEWGVAHCARTGEKWPYDMPSWVFTHRDLDPIGEGITFTSAPVPEVHAEMTAAAGGKGLWVVGGGDLAGQFADAGLLDEIVTYIAPVTLGAGRPVFPRRYELKLVELAQNQAFACARYEVVGPPRLWA
ncbi:dihydrofolate reductase family protein [Nocardioides sp. cx-173]|uniref:dihydrofolate reductase family protein n=1 Tax=Nocardioides sp. cx-173 TaxID=2898796 RepID=UPI001E4C2E4A|nr:dihydrofolate reductase family protein [Nocardioides sp. cx-173]MCD4527091.1 dihydrofolate reductase family protein [Nocardioides sp. cx-173]UGB42455.1 dihydrofolate reductase family protein [Nocardioides sp. cx-173]